MQMAIHSHPQPIYFQPQDRLPLQEEMRLFVFISWLPIIITSILLEPQVGKRTLNSDDGFWKKESAF